MTFGRNALQVDTHRTDGIGFRYDVIFKNGGDDAISHRKLLPSGEWTRNDCPAPEERDVSQSKRMKIIYRQYWNWWCEIYDISSWSNKYIRKYALNDGVGFSIWRHTFKMVAIRHFTQKVRLPVYFVFDRPQIMRGFFCWRRSFYVLRLRCATWLRLVFNLLRSIGLWQILSVRRKSIKMYVRCDCLTVSPASSSLTFLIPFLIN